MTLRATASQTVGPFFHIGLTALSTTELAGEDVEGERVTIHGRVLDGTGLPVHDAVIEIWQANAHGRYAHPEDEQDKPRTPDFQGFGRIPTGDDGAFRFTTIKPGPVPGPKDTTQAPHLVVTVFMRGLLRHLLTRLYFPDEPLNAADPVLALVPAERRATLIATKNPSGVKGRLEWNILLQGAEETVFFDF
jgi:protocatechuate 3,4-dioxygenase alpha subunit